VQSWLIAMYEDVQTLLVVRTSGGDSRTFDVKMGVHQGSVLSSLLFVIAMEILTHS